MLVAAILFLILSAIFAATSCTSGASERKAEMYMVLYKPLCTYIEGQKLAHETKGTYMQLFYMVQEGFLPGNIPRTDLEFDTYYKFIETNITADTLTDEVRPPGQHFDSFNMEFTVI